MPIYTIQECPKARGEPAGEVLGTQKRKSEDRFHVGDKIVLPRVTFSKELRIVSSVPTDNPAGEDVTYLVEYMADIAKMIGGDPVAFPELFIHRKRIRFWT